jgi:hypothetical protein
MSGHDLNLRILGVEPGEEADGARRLTLQTTRGDIALIVHGASAPGPRGFMSQWRAGRA